MGEARFHTPQPVPKLGLDLVSLTGGGPLPAEFNGETTDGRALYARYRGGRLAIWLADRPGADPVHGGCELVRVDLGPPWRGTLSCGQLMRLADLRVPGPVPSPSFAHEEFDLDGSQSFYFDAVLATSETVEAWIEAVAGSGAKLWRDAGVNEQGPFPAQALWRARRSHRHRLFRWAGRWRRGCHPV